MLVVSILFWVALIFFCFSFFAFVLTSCASSYVLRFTLKNLRPLVWHATGCWLTIHWSLQLKQKRPHAGFSAEFLSPNLIGAATVSPTGCAMIVLVMKEWKVNKKVNQSHKKMNQSHWGANPQDGHQ
jgi:hypothetical protein